MSMIINDFIGSIGCNDEFYSPYIPTTSERVTISIKDIAILDSRRENCNITPIYNELGFNSLDDRYTGAKTSNIKSWFEKRDPMSMVEGRWMGERITSLRNLIKIKTIHHKKYNSILIVDEEIEGLVNRLSDFEIRLDEWIDHDIDPFVEYFGFIRDLKIHCFRINLHRGDDLYIRRAMSPSYPIPPDEPPIRQMYG